MHKHILKTTLNVCFQNCATHRVVSGVCCKKKKKSNTQSAKYRNSALNNPINSPWTKSSPSLHSFLVREVFYLSEKSIAASISY